MREQQNVATGIRARAKLAAGIAKASRVVVPLVRKCELHLELLGIESEVSGVDSRESD